MMTGHANRFALIVSLTLILAAGQLRADGDAGTFQRLGFDDRPQVCLFLDTVALRDEYLDRGLRFRGPAPLDGGGVLASCAFFLVVGYTPPNFLAFNKTTEYSDGGIPRDPQTILLTESTSFAQANVGAAIEVGYPATMSAHDAKGNLLASTTVALARETVPLLVEAPGIATITITAPGARYILDDLLWGESAGGDLEPAPAGLAVTLAAGTVATRTVTLHNRADHDLEFFVQERRGDRASMAMVTRPAELAVLGDPIPLPNLRAEGHEQQPVRYRSSDRGGRDLRLLVFTEFDPDDLNYDTDLDHALRSLDIPYTAIYAYIAGFREALQDEDWDAVIFDHQLTYLYEFDYPVYDELLAYVRGGGRLVMSTWQIHNLPDHPLWEELGFRWIESYEQPQPVIWTDAEPRFFQVPNDVPDFVELGDFYVIDGHRLAALPVSTVLARLLPSAGTGRGDDVMILANGGRTLYRGFLDGANVVDRDEDGVLDTVELWRNVLVQMLAEDVPWVRATAEGMVPAGSAGALDVDLDATGLSPGTYTAHLELRTNEAVHDTYVLPLALTVTSEPTRVRDQAEASGALQAYPNPFNPATTLAFDLPAPGSVGLQVYDAAGRLVRTLLEDEPHDRGRHRVRWDGRDHDGRAVAAGVYLARLQSGEAVQAQRLVLVR